MEELGVGLDADSASIDQKQTNLQESRLLSIQRCIKYLIHACQCEGRDANCRLPSCQKMKRVVQHAKSCKQKKGGGCPICKQMIAICCYHAKYCQEAKCPIPFCVNIKTKLRHQQLQQRLEQALILKRRIAIMQNRGISCPVVQTSPGSSNSSIQPSPGAQPHSSPQPGIGMKAATGPPVGALQVVQRVQAKCPVPFSVNIKTKLRHQELQQRLQQAQILKRHIATMQNRGISCPDVQTSPGNSNSSNQPSPGAQPHSSPHPPQPGIGNWNETFTSCSTSTTVASRQTAPHMVAASVNYGKGNPVVSPPTANAGLMPTTQQMQKPMSPMMSGVLNMSNVDCLFGRLRICSESTAS